MKKIITFILISLLLSAAILFWFKNKNLDTQLSQTKQINQKVQEELKRLQEDKESVLKENDKLQSDAVSYLSVNSKLQKEKEELETKLKAEEAKLRKKELDLKEAKEKLKAATEKLAREDTVGKAQLVKEKEELEKKTGLLEEGIKNERALYHYNLAVAYTQAKLFDEALRAYEKSLTFNPENADAHYNLGLIYSNAKFDPEKAILHYKKYLQLRPNAEDKEEVEEWISKLK